MDVRMEAVIAEEIVVGAADVAEAAVDAVEDATGAVATGVMAAATAGADGTKPRAGIRARPSFARPDSRRAAVRTRALAGWDAWIFVAMDADGG